MGAMSRLINKPLKGKLVRVRPTAAIVPNTVARRVANGATMKLLRAARVHSSESNKFEYHFSVHPGIGYTKNDESENDSGTIAAIGNNKKIMTVTHTIRRVHQPTLSSNVAYAGNFGLIQEDFRSCIVLSHAQFGFNNSAVDAIKNEGCE